MKYPNRHIIQKLAVELTCSDESAGKQIYQVVGDYLRTDILPELEAFFDQVAPPGKHLRLDRLDLDVGILPFRGWEKALKQQVMEQVRQQIASLKSVSGPGSAGQERQTSSGQTASEAYLFFLENGHLPWWQASVGVSELEKMLMSNGQTVSLARKMLVLFQRDLNSLRRFARQSSDEFFEQIRAVLQPDGWKENIKNAYKTLLRKAMSAAEAVQWFREAVLFWIVSPENRTGPVTPARLFRQLADNSDLLKRYPALKPESGPWPENETFENKQPQPQDSGRSADTAWYITDAGIVLLSPFLPAFFETLGLTRQQAFAGIAQQETAVLWLHYLCTGSKDCSEDGTLLLKLLCGLPPDHPVPQHLHIPAAQKKEAEQLLKAVIEHWSVLKKTSPDGLRQGFLQRTGKLTDKVGQWHLIVERQAQDILFDRLPWGFSVIKYPWMPEMLIVEW